MKAKPWILFCGVILLCLSVMAILRPSMDTLVQRVQTTGAVEQPLDSVRVWWARAARCLAVDTTVPARTRVFAGGSLPLSWKLTTDRGQDFGGYTSRNTLIWVRGMSADIVTHEVWHVKFGNVHPSTVFGPDGHTPRCGLAPTV